MRAPIIVRAACLAIAIGGPGCDRKSDSPGTTTAASPPPTAQAIEASLVAAESYFNARDLVSAETILVKLIERAPREHRAHELYGGVLYVKGLEARQRGAEADDLFRQASRHYEIAVEAAADLEPLVSAGLHQSAGEARDWLCRCWVTSTGSAPASDMSPVSASMFPI